MAPFNRKIYLLLAIIFLICANPGICRGEVKIAILTSDALISTQRTLVGVKKTIGQENPDATYYQFQISASSDQNLLLIDSINNIEPTLIFTIGTSATKLAKENFEKTPIVFSAVKYPVLSGFVNSLNRPGGNITGASIDIPIDIQFKKFKQIVPNLNTIGVLYTPNTANLIPQAKIYAQKEGLNLIALKVNGERELPHALDSLSKVVQGIWSLADNNLFDPKSTRYILLNTIKRNIPFMGFSRYIVESGALFALDFDYKSVGSQAGEIVNKIIRGEQPGNISVTSADIIWFHYNERTAQRINIKIPDELAAVAKEVYR